MSAYLLSTLIWLPIVGGVVLLAMGDDRNAKSARAGMMRWTALAFSVATFVLSIGLYTGFDNGMGAMQFVERSPWIDALNVTYAIGGSFASALHGVMRATMDADLVADLQLEHTAPLAQALGDAFFSDVEMMRDAIHHHSSFNLIHLETMFKVDVFVAKPRAFDRSQLARRQLHMLSEDPERHAYVTSAEDIVLAKLEWYRQGSETSDRQWRDVLGLLKVQGDRLDREYMQRMAAELRVVDLLRRAFEEAA